LKNAIVAPKIAAQFALLKMHFFVTKAAIGMMVKIPGNRVDLLKAKVNAI